MVLLLAALLQAPAAPAATPQAYEPPPGLVERVRRELETERAFEPRPRKDIPTFRVRVEEKALEVRGMWQEEAIRSGFVRPRHPAVHYEFLKAVTPEEFRGATLHPIGIPVERVVQFLGGKWNTAVRKRRESRAKREVEEALRQFVAETGQVK